MKESNNYPSLLQQGKNLAKFSWKFIKYLQENGDESLIVSDEIYNDRLETCKSCPKYDKEQSRCYECGCFLLAKAKFILEDCPLNKWTSINEEDWEASFNNIINDIDINE